MAPRLTRQRRRIDAGRQPDGSGREQVSPHIEDAVDLRGIDERVEGGLRALCADRVTQDGGGPLETLANIGTNLGVADEVREHPRSLTWVADGHEAPQVAQVLVANGALAWFLKPLADLGALGQDERGNLGDMDLGGQSSGFSLGERVFHLKFGYGEVIQIEGNKLTIDFEKAGTKKVLESFIRKG